MTLRAQAAERTQARSRAGRGGLTPEGRDCRPQGVFVLRRPVPWPRRDPEVRGRPSISHTSWAAMCVRGRAAGRERQGRRGCAAGVRPRDGEQVAGVDVADPPPERIKRVHPRAGLRKRNADSGVGPLHLCTSYTQGVSNWGNEAFGPMVLKLTEKSVRRLFISVFM